KDESFGELSAIDARPGVTWQPANVHLVAAARSVAACLGRSRALAALGAAREPKRPSTLSSSVGRWFRLLAGGDSLAAVAALDDVLLLAGALLLSGVLFTCVHWPDANRRASPANFDRACRADRLDRP